MMRDYQYHGYTPRQGDIITVNLDPQVGREIKKRRPVVVVSSDGYNAKTGFVQACPITHIIRKRAGFFSMNTRHVTGQVNAIQLRSLDFISERRAIKKVDELDPETFGKVAQFIRFIFDFDQVIDFGE